MNIQEANKKICPFIQSGAAYDTENSPSIHGVKVKNIRCIADNCMAWHWHVDDTEYPNGKLKFSTTDGYCRRIHEGEC